MDKVDLRSFSLDELWALHEEITRVLSTRILAQKQELEQRLLQLNQRHRLGDSVEPRSVGGARQRRRYPRVSPKYRNPLSPQETWSGRGKQPRWLVAALEAGGKIEDFVISGD
jgi:DNA-binding protein H-NS